MANPVIRSFVAKELFKKGGAIANSKSVDFSTNALETRLTNIGVDVNLIKTQNDLKQALAFAKQFEDQIFKKEFGDVLKKKETAKIFDLDRNRLKFPGLRGWAPNGHSEEDNPFNTLADGSNYG